MSNQPKIAYRSDTTKCMYLMLLSKGSFTVGVTNMVGDPVDESHPFIYLANFRANVNSFFDVVTHHINTGKWG